MPEALEGLLLIPEPWSLRAMVFATLRIYAVSSL